MKPLALVLDGAPVPADAPAFSPLERGLLYGDGLFETIAVHAGVALDAAAHRARLEASCRALGFPLPPDWSEPIARCLEASGGRAGVVRVTWTRGAASARGYAPSPEDGPGRLLVAAFEPPPPVDGVRAASVRGLCAGDLARHKTTSALARVVALGRAREAGAREAILLDDAGRVLEASSSNVFAVRNGEVVTPPKTRPLLPGLARARALAWTGGREADLSVEDLAGADEAFLTNAVVGAVALLAIDGHALGEPGPVTRDVIARDRAWRRAQS